MIENENLSKIDYYNRDSKRYELEKRFKDLMCEELNLGGQISYVGNKNLPILRIYRYKEAFSYKFVKIFLKRFSATQNDYVFDPFSGLGTTLFTSFVNYIPSIGIDKLPLAFFLSKTLPLFLKLKKGELNPFFRQIKSNFMNFEPAKIASDVAIVQKAFNNEILEKLCKIKSAIDDLPLFYRDIFLYLYFSVLEECSYTAKDGQFLRLVKDKVLPDPIDALKKKIIQVNEDILRYKFFYPEDIFKEELVPEAYLGDSRDLSNIKFKKPPTIIITSPPYCNRYDYTRTYTLELIFNFIKNFDELKKIRFGILRSHVESKIKDGEKCEHPIIQEVLEELKDKKINNPRIPIMISTYFIDMEKCISEWYRILSNKAKVALAIDNVRYEGELIPVDLVLSDMAENIGFKTKKVIVARYKGNSSQQMKKYGRVPVRESIVIWEK